MFGTNACTSSFAYFMFYSILCVCVVRVLIDARGIKISVKNDKISNNILAFRYYCCAVCDVRAHARLCDDVLMPIRNYMVVCYLCGPMLFYTRLLRHIAITICVMM